MLTTSHAFWTWRAARGRPSVAEAVLGAVAPDLPGWIGWGALSARGVPREELLGALYHDWPWREVHLAVHAVWGPALAAALGRRALAAGWLGHLLVDYATHHDDAWPPLWPLSGRAWRSPVSYWQREHHARAWTTVEVAALAAAVLADRGSRRAVAVGALAIAAWPLVAGRGENLWTGMGARPVVRPRPRLRAPGRASGTSPGAPPSPPGP
jgi:hypothetical protein